MYVLKTIVCKGDNRNNNQIMVIHPNLSKSKSIFIPGDILNTSMYIFELTKKLLVFL